MKTRIPSRSTWLFLALRVVVFLSLSRATADVELGFVDAMIRPSQEEELPMRERGSIEGAKGEWEPVQIVVRGRGEDLSGLRLVIESPVHESGAALTRIEKLRGDWIEVVRSTEFAALDRGFYVDPLVPIPDGTPILRDPVNPGRVRNQSLWLDVHLPRDATAGTYRGRVGLVRPDGQELVGKELKVEVWDFSLPRVVTMKSLIGLNHRKLAELYGLELRSSRHNQLCRRYDDLLADHRLAVEGFWGSGDVFDSDRKQGSLAASWLPSLGSPRDVFQHFFEEKGLANGSIGLWPEWPLEDGYGKNRKTSQRMLGQVMKEFEALGWSDRIAATCAYIDEPGSREEYDEVRKQGAFYNELEEQFGVKLPLYVTEQPEPESWEWGSLHGAVDIYVSHVSDLWDDMHGRGTRQVEQRLQAGDEIWMYPAMVQVPGEWRRRNGNPRRLEQGNPPAWILDFPPMNYRIFAWAAPLYGVTGVLYWDAMTWREGIDPWQRADTFRLGRGIYNGDGLLVYPGYRQEVGFDGPVASVRLKWVREAMEDHAYLTLLLQAGREEKAKQLIRRICRNIGDWDADPVRLRQVRREIAGILIEEQSGTKNLEQAER